MDEGIQLLEGSSSDYTAEKDVDQYENVIFRSGSSLQGGDRHESFELGHEHQDRRQQDEENLQRNSRKEPLNERLDKIPVEMTAWACHYYSELTCDGDEKEKKSTHSSIMGFKNGATLTIPSRLARD